MQGKASNKTSITASSQYTGPSAPETVRSFSISSISFVHATPVHASTSFVLRMLLILSVQPLALPHAALLPLPYPCSCAHHCPYLSRPCLLFPCMLMLTSQRSCNYFLLRCETMYPILQEPLITPEEANARLTSAKLPPLVSTIPGADGSSPKSPETEALPEGFELSPFSPSVRWAKDRKARKLASGATAVVYRSAFSFLFSLFSPLFYSFVTPALADITDGMSFSLGMWVYRGACLRPMHSGDTSNVSYRKMVAISRCCYVIVTQHHCNAWFVTL